MNTQTSSFFTYFFSILLVPLQQIAKEMQSVPPQQIAERMQSTGAPE